jgi:hypothetical protein
VSSKQVRNDLPGRGAFADLDRRVLPAVAVRVDRFISSGARRMPGRVPLGVRERRILAALALLLLGCAVALALNGA